MIGHDAPSPRAKVAHRATPNCDSLASPFVALSRPAQASAIRSAIEYQADIKCSMRAFPLMTQMYGPAVRRKRISLSWRQRSCVNVSGL
jgi:hypothetical protein